MKDGGARLFYVERLLLLIFNFRSNLIETSTQDGLCMNYFSAAGWLIMTVSISAVLESISFIHVRKNGDNVM